MIWRRAGGTSDSIPAGTNRWTGVGMADASEELESGSIPDGGHRNGAADLRNRSASVQLNSLAGG